MKTFRFLTFFLLSTALVTACEELITKVPTFSIATNLVQFEASESTTTIAVTSDVSWDVEVSEENASWLSAEKGSEGVVIHARANDLYSTREGIVTVNALDKTNTISVSQKGASISFVSNCDTIKAPVVGKTLDILATLNVDWFAEGSEKWIKLENAEGKAGETVEIKAIIDTTSAYEPREAAINFYFGYNKVGIIPVYQEAFVPVVSISQTSWEASLEGETLPVSVSANMEWTVKSSSSWVTTDISGGEKCEAQTVNISIEEATGQERNATVVFIAGNASDTLKIHQNKAKAKPISIDMVFSNGTASNNKILSPAFQTSASASFDLGLKTYSLLPDKLYSFEIYSSYCGSLINGKAGLIFTPGIKAGYNNHAIRSNEGFAYMKFPAIEGFKLSTVKLVTNSGTASSTLFPVYITATYGSSNEEAINTALAYNENVGRKGSAEPTILTLEKPAENTSYYLFMPQVKETTTAYQYQFWEISLLYVPVEE